MHTDRMKDTIDLLRRVHAQSGDFQHAGFDYSAWVQEEDDCGTVACAGGFMCLYAPFRDQGLSYDTVLRVPTYAGETSTNALAFFLGLTPDQARTAFIDLDTYLTKQTGRAVELHDVTAEDVADYLDTMLGAAT